MKYLFFIFLANLYLAQTKANVDAFLISQQIEGATDTILNITKQDSLIEEVIEAKTSPDKSKVEYLSQYTKYGFGNLFTKFGYSSSLPYSAQVNPKAEYFMQGYMAIHSSRLNKMKSWGLPYFNLIDNILIQYGLPRELKYLAVIESDLSTAATSSAGAGGPWQFMPYTARDYGLIVTPGYDERRDYQKSTHAAARYLLTLYKQMHDWLLVIAAYNGGPERVLQAIKKSGSRDFWTLQYYLPEESRNHVKKFIATHYVMEASGNEVFSNGSNSFAPTSKPIAMRSGLTAIEQEEASVQTISGKYNGTIIAKNLSMDMIDFNRYNPGFDLIIANGGDYDLALPPEKMQQFLAIKYQILNECVQFILGDNSIPNTKTVYPKKNKTRKKSPY